jgi:hypothetical protein
MGLRDKSGRCGVKKIFLLKGIKPGRASYPEAQRRESIHSSKCADVVVKASIFHDVTSCSVESTEVSEDRTVSIFRIQEELLMTQLSSHTEYDLNAHIKYGYLSYALFQPWYLRNI